MQTSSWIRYKTWKVWIVFFLIVNLTKVYSLCVFGDENECLLPCRCQGDSGCHPDTGQCIGSDSCSIDPLLSSHPVDENQYWTGDACQTGDVGRGRTARQIGTYYNPGFKINATADLAVDGNISTYAYSRNSPTAWWSVDLGHVHKIEMVFIIANNLGNSLILLENYTVWVGLEEDVFTHSLCGVAPSPLVPTYGYSETWNWNEVKCNLSANQGRYLSIRKADHDTVKNWLPIHEVAIIGYPVVSTQMGRCLKHKDSSAPDLLQLECDQCTEGWLEPDCKVPGNDTKSRRTMLTTPVTHKTTQFHYSTMTPNSSLLMTSQILPTSSMNDTGVIAIDEPSGTALTVILLGVLPVVAILVIISLVAIAVLCIKMRRMNRMKNQIGQNTTNVAPLYFKRDDIERSEKVPEVGYQGLLRNQPDSTRVYMGLESDNKNGGKYYNTPPNKGDPRYMIAQSTPSLFDGTAEYLALEGNTYTDTFVAKDTEGYMVPTDLQRQGHTENSVDNDGYATLPVDDQTGHKNGDIYDSVNDYMYAN